MRIGALAGVLHTRGEREGSLMDRLAGLPDELLRVLLDESPTGALILDRNRRIVRVNEALRRMVSCRVDVRPGQAFDTMFLEGEREPVAAMLRRYLGGTGGGHKLVTRLETDDHDPDHQVEISVSVLREADRTIAGLLLRIADVTARKRLEAQLVQSQKLQAVGQLAGGIAHDFNNLLTAVLAAADLALERDGTEPATIDDLRQIRAGAERGAALVRQLLAFGRRQAMQSRIIPVNEAIQDLSGLLGRLLGGQIRLKLDLETPGRMVRVDPTQLDQVLVNLAVNARDAMPDGGVLTLRSGHKTLYRPWVQGQETIPPGRYVMIEVADTGVGIPPDVLPRIFDPFFTTRRERGGSGLGLSTVHGIVRQSHGYLSVHSEVGKGTRLRLYLPRNDEAAATVAAPTPVAVRPAPAPEPPPAPAPEPPPAPVPPPEASRRSRTVILVDDEEAVRRLTERAFVQRGWTVLSADSAEAALALLDPRPAAETALPSILITDMVMPGMDGAKLVTAVRQLLPGLPAILVSGYAEEMLRQDVTGPGVAFLSKPYALRSLLSKADELTAASEAQSKEDKDSKEGKRVGQLAMSKRPCMTRPA